MCRKYFVPHHRGIGAIWFNFKRFNAILNNEILLNLLHKMTYVDKFQLCFCFALATLNSYILFLHSQHSWHLCRQLATYALSYLCILLSKRAWRHRYRCTCNSTKTIEQHIIVFCAWYLRNCTRGQQSSYPCSEAWALEGFFSRVEIVMKFHFFLLETKNTTMFAKNVIETY